MTKELEARLRGPQCSLALNIEAADQLERYRVALEAISVCNVSMNGAIARQALQEQNKESR